MIWNFMHFVNLIAAQARAGLVKISGSKDNRSQISDLEFGSIFREIESLYGVKAG